MESLGSRYLTTDHDLERHTPFTLLHQTVLTYPILLLQF